MFSWATRRPEFASLIEQTSDFVVDRAPADPLHEVVEIELLRRVVRQGEVGRDRCTPHHPKTFPGLMAYGERTKALRDLLKRRRWRAMTTDGIESVVSPTRRHAIVTMGGDEHTGQRDGAPRPLYDKGPAMRAAIELHRQLDLLEANSEPTITELPTLTWILLVHRDRERGSVHSELSLPWRDSDGSDAVSGWIRRFVLPQIDLDEDPHRLPVPRFPPSDDISITIARKQA